MATLIVPIKNENKNIAFFLRFLAAHTYSISEVIFVIDEPTDQGILLIKDLASNYCQFDIIIQISPNKDLGMGFAAAVLRSKNPIVGVFPVDDFLPIIEIDKFVNKISEEKYDLVSANRYSNNGKRFGKVTLSAIISKVINLLVSRITSRKLPDFTTGIKFWSRDKFLDFTFEENKGWANIINIGVHAYKCNYQISDVPIVSVDRPFDEVKRGLSVRYFAKMTYFYFNSFLEISKSVKT